MSEKTMPTLLEEVAKMTEADKTQIRQFVAAEVDRILEGKTDSAPIPFRAKIPDETPVSDRDSALKILEEIHRIDVLRTALEILESRLNGDVFQILSMGPVNSGDAYKTLGYPIVGEDGLKTRAGDLLNIYNTETFTTVKAELNS